MKRKTDSAQKNPAAVDLGRKAAGVPKNFSPADLARRRKLMEAINARRRAGKGKRK
jgi:hypothetical protein